uniref:Intercellular adhesion molecule 2 n=1 Tax=Cercocebus atys TaxID=9531 RepID=A0A2K5L5Z6_CERAT
MSSFGFGTLTMALFALVCCSGSDEKAFEVHMRLEKLITSLNKILLLEQTQWKHYLISNISHDTVLWCHFTCSGKQKSMSSNVSVYQPPRQVFLTLQPTWVAVGKSFTIECRVPAVEPLDSLTLSLLRGSETLHSQTFGKAAPAQPVPDSQMVIIVTVVSVLLFLFVTSVLLCFIFSQHWRQRRMGTYGVRAAWRRLPQAFRP